MYEIAIEISISQIKLKQESCWRPLFQILKSSNWSEYPLLIEQTEVNLLLLTNPCGFFQTDTNLCLYISSDGLRFLKENNL